MVIIGAAVLEVRRLRLGRVRFRLKVDGKNWCASGGDGAGRDVTEGAIWMVLEKR